jgi:hypothetical protein
VALPFHAPQPLVEELFVCTQNVNTLYRLLYANDCGIVAFRIFSFYHFTAAIVALIIMIIQLSPPPSLRQRQTENPKCHNATFT